MSNILASQLRVPPHNTEVEQAILGTLLLDPKAVPLALAELEAGHFYSEKHRQVYHAIQHVSLAGEHPDIMLVVNQLKKDGNLDAVGGAAYLAGLTGGIPAASRLPAYVKLIREKAQLRRMIEVASKAVDEAYAGEEPSIILDQFGRKFFEVAAGKSETARPISETLPGIFQSIENRLGKGSAGLQTGFVDLDKLTTGLHPSDLIILAARPSMGKTSFAMQIAINAARMGKRTLVFSLEMSAGQLQERLLSQLSGVNFGAIRQGNISNGDWPKLVAAKGALQDLPIVISDAAGVTVNQIHATAKMVHIRTPIDLIIIDYLQLIRGQGENRTLVVADISQRLKALAKDLNVPALVLSQLNRGLESRTDKRPIMSDLRDSGAIEQDADVIAFIYRHEVYQPDVAKGIAEIIIRKQRNGPTSDVKLGFVGETFSFKNLTVREEW